MSLTVAAIFIGIPAMNDCLRDLSPTNLIHAIESNIFPFFEAFQQWPGAEVHDEASLLWTITDVPFSLLNCGMRARIPPERVDSTIEAVIARARLRHVPVLWLTGPESQPADLGMHLEKHGFIGEDSAGMAIDLAQLKEDLPVPAGFAFQQVTDAAALRIWGQVFGAAFGAPDSAVAALCDLTLCTGLDKMRSYLGWLNGKAVAISALFLGAGVAGIYNVATLPEARRQGIGALITALPLREARTEGYKAGVLQASEMGEPVYRTLGFREYCKIGFYEWSPE
jgi:GNAT superfamily N-acetyltransferase